MSVGKFQKGESEGLRSSFKDSLTKLMQISTRELGYKELRALIHQNKTTINLRIWLSVLSENRKRHSESEINVLGYIVQQYGKGLLDPLDKIPSVEKTVFRITELLIKLYFSEDNQVVALALQKVWTDIYLITLDNEESSLKKKLLYDCLEAIINGGAGRISQCTAQVAMEGILQASLNREDLNFFKQIAKRILVLFLKTTIQHPAVLTCLQTVLSYFNIINLIPLLDNIVNKVLSYVSLAQSNSTGYRIKAEVSNVLALIGDQLDQNGVAVQEKVIKGLEGLATDKVWAVQVTGRKALNVWKNKKKQWEQEYVSKNQQFYPSAQNFYKPEEEEPEFKRPLTAQNFRPKVVEDFVKPQRQNHSPDYSQSKYLHKNTGAGGGNTAQNNEQQYQRQRPQETYNKKMEEIKKSIYKPKQDFTQYDETVQWDAPIPNAPTTQIQPPPQLSEIKSEAQSCNPQRMDEEEYLAGWERIMDLFERGKKEDSAKAILDLDDDIYFLRFMLKYGKGLLGELTRPTAAKILKKMLSINKTHFMEQLLLKFAAETAKSGTGSLLTTQQTLSISDNLQRCSKTKDLQRPAKKVKHAFERSLQ